MKKIIIINGPNLNLLGKRETHIYGTESFEDILGKIRTDFSEGELLDKLHEVGFNYDGIILNGGAYTHTSIAIGDAIAAISTPVIEVHISNVYAREEFRHHSYFSAHCAGLIVGFGIKGYNMAVNYFNEKES